MLKKDVAGAVLPRWLGLLRSLLPSLLLSLLLLGCASSQGQRYERLRSELRRATPQTESVRQSGAGDELNPGAELDAAEPSSRLDRQAYVRAVLARNPNIEAARHAFRAALAQHPQANALEDPMLEYAFAPLSIGSRDVSYGQSITVSQRLPWPGKRALQGEVALAQAEAAKEDYETTRLRLALIASTLFDQYYAAVRALALNAEHHTLVQDIKAAAEAQYRAGRVSQQEPLQAELELSHVLHERLVFETRVATIRAQMNELLHRPPQQVLPLPPEQLAPELEDVPDSVALQKLALAQRPELRGRQAGLRGSASAVDLAERKSYPDFGVSTSYNSMWAMPEHQWMVGGSINVPIQLGARRAAVEQASARFAQGRSELAALEAQIRAEVEQARQTLLEARHVIVLYRERLMPTARALIESARIAYATGRGGFQGLIDAERSVRSLELNYQDALATLGQRRAELARALGHIPGFPRQEVAR